MRHYLMYRAVGDDSNNCETYHVAVEYIHDICLDYSVDTVCVDDSVDTNCRKMHPKDLVRCHHLGDAANLRYIEKC